MWTTDSAAPPLSSDIGVPSTTTRLLFGLQRVGLLVVFCWVFFHSIGDYIGCFCFKVPPTTGSQWKYPSRSVIYSNTCMEQWSVAVPCSCSEQGAPWRRRDTWEYPTWQLSDPGFKFILIIQVLNMSPFPARPTRPQQLLIITLRRSKTWEYLPGSCGSCRGRLLERTGTRPRGQTAWDRGTNCYYSF